MRLREVMTRPSKTNTGREEFEVGHCGERRLFLLRGWIVIHGTIYQVMLFVFFCMEILFRTSMLLHMINLPGIFC